MFVQLTLSALFLAAALIEIVLLVAKGFLLGTRRMEAIEAQIREAQEGLKKTLPLIAERRNKLKASYDESQKIIEGTREVNKEVAALQRVRPILVHMAGQPGGPARMRAQLTKMITDPNDKNQALIWEHENYVEVWTSDAKEARETALRQFPPEAGYTIEPFVPHEVPATTAAQKVA